MGLPFSLAVRSGAEQAAQVDRAWAECVASLRWSDRVFSTYRSDSFISRLARGEADLADGPAEVAEVFALGEEASAATEGAFTLYPGGRLDPSGVVKGWAAERAAVALLGLGELDWCLNAGGDVLCSSPSGAGWRIGIEDPHDRRRLVAGWQVNGGALATSGTAHRGAHVVDGRSGRSAETWASVSVLAGSLTRADIDATAALALGDSAPAWLTRRLDAGLIDGFVLVDPHGTVLNSANR